MFYGSKVKGHKVLIYKNGGKIIGYVNFNLIQKTENTPLAQEAKLKLIDP
jgi:hypothetical protein